MYAKTANILCGKVKPSFSDGLSWLQLIFPPLVIQAHCAYKTVYSDQQTFTYLYLPTVPFTR